MTTKSIAYIVMPLLTLLLLKVSNAQSDEPIINNKTGKDVGQTFGFYLGQSYSLDHIASKFPRLVQQVTLARMKFDATFKPSIDNMDASFSKQGSEWTNLKADLRKRLRSTLDFSGLTKQQAEEFIQSVERRANGDIPSPILETLLLFNPPYIKNPVAEFSDGFKSRFASDGATKAKGVGFHVDYPRSWLSEEANRPNIVRKFISENGRGMEMVMILVIALPTNEPITENDIRNMSSPSELRSAVPPNATYLDGGSIRIDNKPGYFQKYSVTTQQLDIPVLARVISYTVFHGNKIIQIQCQVGATQDQAKSLDHRFQRFEPLFRQIANSLVIQSQWK